MVKEETSMKLYRGALISLVVLAGLYGVYYWSEGKKPETKLEDKTITIFETSKENILSVDIENVNGKVGFKRDGEEWKLNPYKNISLIKSKVEGLIYDVANIKAEQIIEKDAKNLEMYGLDTPISIVFIKLGDGTEKIFYVGDSTPSKANHYFKEKDSGEVYSVYASKAEAFAKGLEEYRERTIFSFKPEDIREIAVEGKDLPKILIKAKEVKKDEKAEDKTTAGTLSTWDMIEPYNRSVDNEKIQQIILSKLTGINVDQFVEDEPKDLAQYGLDKPQYTVNFVDAHGKSITFLLGYSKDDSIYIKTPERNSVYLVDASNFEFKDADAFAFIEKFAYIVNIDTVNKILIEADGKQTTLEITHSTEEGKEDTYKVRGKDAEEGAFKKLYQDVIGLILDGPLMAKEKEKLGKTIASCTFYHIDGTQDVNVKYVSIDDRRCAVVKNGTSEFYIQKKKVTAMLDALKGFGK
jgi:hypothetical protein